MISILLPIYNYDVVKFAKSLNDQCVKAKVDYEIVCFDDGSNKKYRQLNRALDHEFGISYIELSDNQGRSKIRNKLAQNARYEHLLFLDCDSGMINENFVQRYLEEIPEGDVIYGGRKYSAKPPRTDKKMLHWKYGKTRESLPLGKRVKKPHLSFQSNNFLIKRETFLKVLFSEKITGYGYEDLLFADKLKKEGIPIKHIDNPILHKGVERNDLFLEKSKRGAENLALLYHQGLIGDTRMLKFYKNAKTVGFNSFLHTTIQRKSDQILKNLSSGKPNLYFFDLYRLNIFHNKLSELEASSS